MSGVSYFWTYATKNECTPWGVTANLLINRSCNNHKLLITNKNKNINNIAKYNNTSLRFDSKFIKTGGGEDIDFCLQLRKQPMKSVPLAICYHPWWKNGSRCYEHFFRWAYGDSLLLIKYPKLTYINYPNVIEFSFLLCLLYILLTIIYLYYYILNNYIHEQMNLCINRKYIIYTWVILLWNILLLLFIDMLFDIYKFCYYNHYEEWGNELQLDTTGIYRILAAAESCLIKNSSELGHLIGPIAQGYYLSKICTKFDWFCSTFPNVLRIERKNALKRFICFCIINIFIHYSIYHHIPNNI
jgi:hypothetical protein